MGNNGNKTYPVELTFEQIEQLIENLPDNEKNLLANKLNKDTFKKRLRAFGKKIKTVDLKDEDIIKEVKDVRKTYGKK